jgi:hypothetical protein
LDDRLRPDPVIAAGNLVERHAEQLGPGQRGQDVALGGERRVGRLL